MGPFIGEAIDDEGAANTTELGTNLQQKLTS